MSVVNRRRVIAGGLSAATVWPLLANARAATFQDDPFSLGVASGCPTPDSIVLWTRLVFPRDLPPPADPFAPLPEAEDVGPLDVAWEIAEDEAFRRPVQSGVATAMAAFAHSVHVMVFGLQPDCWYFYRFRCGNAESMVGRTRTAPAFDAAVDRFRFAFAACQHYEQGYYGAYRDMAERDLDLVVHLGDYIYEVSYGSYLVRRHGTGWPARLEEYRDRYALYKSDPDLQQAHAHFPWLVIWDDHEVINDYTNDHAPDAPLRNKFLMQRRAAYRAWYEHMPVPPCQSVDFSSFKIYGSHRFGRLLDIALLDARQYRSTPAEAVSDAGEGHSLLGKEQEVWLDETLAASLAKWTVIAQPTLLSERDLKLGEATGYNLDGWDGYRAARRRLLDSVEHAGIKNPLVIGGDLHAFYAADVKDDFRNERSRTVATEFATGSITSDGPTEQSVANALSENPHLKYGSGKDHGYSVMELSSTKAEVDFVAVVDRKDPKTAAAVTARLAVIDGMPGVNRL